MKQIFTAKNFLITDLIKLYVSAMSLLSIHEPAMYKSPASSSSSVSPVTQDSATVRIDLSR